MDDMQREGDIAHADTESYHHMCRFHPGKETSSVMARRLLIRCLSFFYDHPALKSHKWYWRVEPDIDLTCSITCDPFAEVTKHGKTYGYTIALWQNGPTATSLFRKLSA